MQHLQAFYPQLSGVNIDNVFRFEKHYIVQPGFSKKFYTNFIPHITNNQTTTFVQH